MLLLRYMNDLRPILLALTAVAALSLTHPAKAVDIITTFDVSGTCTPLAPFTGTTFSGTLTIDETIGTLTAIDVSFQGLSPFTGLASLNQATGSDWEVLVGNGGSAGLLLKFTTGQTPGSLVGFAGGTIDGDLVILHPSANQAYENLGGSITAAAGVPDGGSTVMLLGAALGALGMTRRFVMS